MTPTPDPVSKESLSPWALRPTIQAAVVRPATAAEIPAILVPRNGGLLPIGALRSYGDACVNPNGLHLSTDRLQRIVHFDKSTGILTCESGVTLKTLLGLVLSAGWCLPVMPGTMLTSVGGAVACDVHGKGHHRVGSFSKALLGFELIVASGEVHVCSRTSNPQLFWATVGGLGQTGIITEVTLQLSPVESSYISTVHLRTRDLAHTLEMCSTLDDDYSVCWIDSLARGAQLGRGVLMAGHHASASEVEALSPGKELFSSPSQLPLSLPFFPPRFLTGPRVWRAFNAAYYSLQGRHPGPNLSPLRPYFFPLDGVAHWNRIYGRNGFIEYQFAVPLATAEAVCREVLERLSASGNGSFLAVLKRLGPASGGLISFPIEGVTLAVDMPAGGPEQAAILTQLDAVVTAAGGRLYFVKDSRMDRSLIHTMYPRLTEWAQFVNNLDPTGLFTSSLVRRLGLRDN